MTLTLHLWPWPFAWTSLLPKVIIPGKLMMILRENHCERVMDRDREGECMDRAIHRAAWSQLKSKILQVHVLQMGCVLHRICILRMHIPLSLCNLCCNEDRSAAKSANRQRMGYVHVVQGGSSVLENKLMWAYVSYPSSSYVLQCGPRSLLRVLVLQWTISCKRSCDNKGEANIFYLPKKTFICCKATIYERNHISI